MARRAEIFFCFRFYLELLYQLPQQPAQPHSRAPRTEKLRRECRGIVWDKMGVQNEAMGSKMGSALGEGSSL